MDQWESDARLNSKRFDAATRRCGCLAIDQEQEKGVRDPVVTEGEKQFIELAVA
jgi:hypothetical protein